MARWFVALALVLLTFGVEAAPGLSDSPLPPGVKPSDLREPLQIGGAAWGPFTRLCEAGNLQGRNGRGQRRKRSCVEVVSNEAIPGGRRITARDDGNDTLRFRFDRRDTGEVGGVELLPAGGATLSETDRVENTQVVLDNLKTFSLSPRRIVSGDEVRLADLSTVPFSGMQAFQEIPCRVQGQARYKGRLVAVLRCAHEPGGQVGATRLSGGLRGWALIDAATGLILRQRSALRLSSEGPDRPVSTVSGEVELSVE